MTARERRHWNEWLVAARDELVLAATEVKATEPQTAETLWLLADEVNDLITRETTNE